MQEQAIDGAISNEFVAASLTAGDEEKMTVRDLLALVEQIAACLAVCGLVHVVF